MFDIARTEELRNTALQLLEQHKKKLAENPESFACQMMVQSAANRLNDLNNRLIEQRQDRLFELVELRLIGESAQNGSLPLYMIGQLSNSFEETLIEIGKYAKHGNRKRKNAFTETRNQLKPKLKRLGAGSTRLFISVDTNPDIFGNSLSDVCISRTFEILSTSDSDDLLQVSATVGNSALRMISRFLKQLLSFNLEADLNWHTPLDTELKWTGNKLKMQRLQASLEKITQSEPIEIIVEGELVTQSLKGEGKFEVITESGASIYGTVPTAVLSQFVQARIGSQCRITVLQIIHQNLSTGKARSFYELSRIESLGISDIGVVQYLNESLNESEYFRSSVPQPPFRFHLPEIIHSSKN
ncbi:hypothetical protein [Spirosoma flavum]|uniref:Uncharacterized protein n=1 Tax=Spirosoma flavum TaxID=2048557 RepID=A0ABW6AQR5_9BACT